MLDTGLPLTVDRHQEVSVIGDATKVRRHLRSGPAHRLDPEVEDRILAEIRRRAALGPSGRPDLSEPHWHNPVALTLVAITALVLALTGILGLGRGGSERVAVDTDGGRTRITTLAELAATARSLPAMPLDDQTPYLHTVVDHIPDPAQAAAGLVGWREERWMASDGSGRARRLPLPGQVAQVDEHDELAEPGVLTVAYLTPSDIADLPTDPVQLLSSLEAAAGERARPDLIATLLALPSAPGPVRGALIEALDLLGAVPEPMPSPSGTASFLARSGNLTVEITIDTSTARPTLVRVTGTDAAVERPASTAFRAAEVTTGTDD